MKKIIVILMVLWVSTTSSNAQTSSSAGASNAKFVAAMEKNIQLLDTASTPETYISLANTFERIGNAEGDQWQPF